MLSITVATAMPCIGATPGAAVRPDRAPCPADCGVASAALPSRPRSVRRCTSRIACRVTSSSVNMDCTRICCERGPCRLCATGSTQPAPLLKLSARDASSWPSAVRSTVAAASSLSPPVALAARTLAQMGFAGAGAELWAIRCSASPVWFGRVCIEGRLWPMPAAQVKRGTELGSAAARLQRRRRLCRRWRLRHCVCPHFWWTRRRPPSWCRRRPPCRV